MGVVVASKLPLHGYMDTPAFLVETTILYKVAYLWAAVFFHRQKYYLGWFLSEAGCIASGLAFSGVQRGSNSQIQSLQWDRVRNANYIAIETAMSFPTITNNWNILTNNWLKNCEPSALLAL